MASTFLRILSPLCRIMPEIKQPNRDVSFKEKAIWTIVALLIYLVMSNMTLVGIDTGAGGVDYFYWWRVLLASSRYTLAELGIGPIVTAGLIMQLLAGSKIIKVDFGDPMDRSLFTGAQKLFAVILTVVQIVAYISAGAYGPVGAGGLEFLDIVLIFIQLFVSGIVIILLDELLQKGWGLGSGVSLFICAGVCMRIIWLCFSPVQGGDGLMYGIVIAFFQTIGTMVTGNSGGFRLNPEETVTYYYNRPNDFSSIWIQRPVGIPTNAEGVPLPVGSTEYNSSIGALMDSQSSSSAPTLIGLITTVVIFLIVIFIETVRVEIPLQYSRYRGFKGKYPIKLLYVSNIPVILVQALYANFLFFGQLLGTQFPTNPWIQIFAKFDPQSITQGGGQFLQPEFPCLLYFLSPPRGLYELIYHPGQWVLHIVVYMVILITLCIWFSKIWVDVSGIAPRDISQQILNSGLMVPGFRRNPRIIEKILKRYIPTVTTLGAIIVGSVAAVADFLGALGTGMGVLLTVGILYQYYQILAQEQLASMNPAMRGLLGMD
ncbi:MAG: preprotein translocase subunit SecY [Candidatus Lokiarchaeota archaeon]|nr:preprotein translocase subunit SecY [Candidatus Lokiarchaeota archaeon]